MARTARRYRERLREVPLGAYGTDTLPLFFLTLNACLGKLRLRSVDLFSHGISLSSKSQTGPRLDSPVHSRAPFGVPFEAMSIDGQAGSGPVTIGALVFESSSPIRRLLLRSGQFVARRSPPG